MDFEKEKNLLISLAKLKKGKKKPTMTSKCWEKYMRTREKGVFLDTMYVS